MTSSQEFCPDWASAPGDTIADILRERSLSVAEFAQLMEQTSQEAGDLLEGRATITIGVARKLQQVLGGSMEFWMSRDFQYRQDTVRLHVAHEDWLAQLPLGDMIKFQWLAPVPLPSEEVSACLRFFGVPSVSAWHDLYGGLQEMVAFRMSPSFDSRPAAVIAWLRQGEIESQSISCRPWDRTRFQDSLPGIRSLTRQKDPSRFLPELQRRCADAGVAVVVVRAPNGCRASGGTRFLCPSKAILLLSFRYLSDDQFWFTFFHEAAHLLLHSEKGFLKDEKGFFLEGPEISSTTKEEQEANEFAARILVPPEFQPVLLALSGDGREVIRFAHRVGVSPGVVVGQLEHYGRINYKQLSSLKRRFTWEESS